jgi:hypothetical protein
VLLEDLRYFFSPYFSFHSESFKAYAPQRISRIYSTYPSKLAFVLWCHWHDDMIDFLPLHFEYYFSVHTLAFWAMRSGSWEGNKYYLHIGRLSDVDKSRLINVLMSKYGLEAKLVANNERLAIANAPHVVKLISPYVMSS